jgi:hypothetical protein
MFSFIKEGETWKVEDLLKLKRKCDNMEIIISFLIGVAFGIIIRYFIAEIKEE